MRAVIFANGIMNKWPPGFELSVQQDLIIAADAGFNHCRKWNVIPHVLIGDMDSVNPSDLEALGQGDVEIQRFPVKKDETDLHLALQLAIDRNTSEIILLGALGDRWDMTLANVLILTAPLLRDVQVKILDSTCELVCLHGHQKIYIDGKPGSVVSLLPLTGSVSGVTLRGFEYTLDNETLPVGTTRGISNILKEEIAEIVIEGGILLVVIDRGC